MEETTKKAALIALVGILALAFGASFARADNFAYVNSAPITVNPGPPANSYPSKVTVSNLVGSVETATVSLVDVNSTNGSDLDILLTGPQSQKVLLMSNACGGALSH